MKTNCAIPPWAAILAVILWLATGLYAQNYSVDWHKIAGGGGTSTGAVYSVSGTLGQHDAGGSMTGGNYSLTGGFWAVYALQMAGSPTLFITQSGTNAILYWSAGATGYLLEYNTNVAASNGWSIASPAPVTINKFNYVTNPITAGKRFYRLYHP